MQMRFSIYLLIALWVLAPVDIWAGEKIIYSRVTDGYWQVWWMNPDGSQAQQLTNSRSDKRDPVCAEGGEKILYRNNNGILHSVDLADGTEKKILDKYRRINNPDYCDEKQQLTFVRFDPGEIDISDIWSADLEGKDVRILTRDHRLQYQPSFDEDCKRIAFVKADNDSRAHHLWLMDADGQNARQLTDEKGFVAGPAFLPGEEGLVFSSNRDGGDYEIYRVDQQGQDLRQLTDNDRLDTGPDASHETGRITFVSNRNGFQQIWTMDADGSRQEVASAGEDESVDPSWCRVTEEQNNP